MHMMSIPYLALPNGLDNLLCLEVLISPFSQICVHFTFVCITQQS